MMTERKTQSSKECSLFIQGEVVAEGGGDRKGKEGIVVGIVGSTVAGSGGRVNCGRVGMVGRDGCGSVGIVGKEGMVGKFGAVVCRRWRAARVIVMHEKMRERRKNVMSDEVDEAIAE